MTSLAFLAPRMARHGDAHHHHALRCAANLPNPAYLARSLDPAEPPSVNLFIHSVHITLAPTTQP